MSSELTPEGSFTVYLKEVHEVDPAEKQPDPATQNYVLLLLIFLRNPYNFRAQNPLLLEFSRAYITYRVTEETMNSSKWIKMKVGGQMFETSLETVIKYPDSKLAAMFQTEREIFNLDLDPQYFSVILSWLR